MRHELNINVAKLVETEQKLSNEHEGRKKAEEKLESLCAQLHEKELCHTAILNELQEKKMQLSKK